MANYKTMFLSVVVVVFILLSILGWIMYKNKDKVVYPSIFPPCPDYYSLNSSNVCVANTSVWSLPNNTPPMVNVDMKNYNGSATCNNMDFKQVPFTNSGMGIGSGLSAKQSWANGCGVSWDGITGNQSIKH